MPFSPPSGNVTTSVQVFEWINSSVGNWYFSGALLVVYAIIIIKMMTNPGNTISKSVAAASFMCMILSVFLRVLNLVSTGFMSIFIVLTVVGAVWMHVENN